MKEYAKIWQGWLDSIEQIPTEQARAEMALAVFRYALRGERYEGNDPFVKILMPIIMKSVDRSDACANSGQKGGLQKAANSGANSNTENDANSGANSGANSNIESNANSGANSGANSHNINININDKGKNININKNIDKNKNTFDFKDYLLTQGVPMNIVEDWLKVRKEKRASNTESAMRKLVRECERAGITLIEAVTMCAENSWQSFQARYLTDNLYNNGISKRTRANQRGESPITDWQNVTEDDMQF